MPVVLEIEDGVPNWYLSHDIWTVPGNNPEGTPGQPIVGQNCYLWARVHNTGTSAVNNATVRFYWANPSVGFDRNTANPIGTSFVSLDAGETAEVLCLTPWTPVFVNGGHECVLAEAFHTSADPLPASPAFNVPTDRHVAQKNLSVLMAQKTMMFHMAFDIHNPSRKARRFVVKAHPGKLEELRGLQKTLGNIKLPQKDGAIDGLGFVRTPCPEEEEIKEAAKSVDKIELAAGTRTGLTLVGRLKGEAALVHVLQYEGDTVVGGLSALVLAPQANTVTQTRKKGA